MKPFPETGDRDQHRFNFLLSSTRMAVERAFGLLKGRFRIIHKQQDTRLENICNVVAACCILHNFCILSGDNPDDDWMTLEGDDGDGDGDNDDDDGSGGSNRGNHSTARARRDALLQYLV